MRIQSLSTRLDDRPYVIDYMQLYRKRRLLSNRTHRRGRSDGRGTGSRDELGAGGPAARAARIQDVAQARRCLDRDRQPGACHAGARLARSAGAGAGGHRQDRLCAEPRRAHPALAEDRHGAGGPAGSRQHLLFQDPARHRGDPLRGRLRHDHQRSRRLAREGGAFRGLHGGRARRRRHSAQRPSVRAEPRGQGQPARITIPLVALCEAIPGADIPQIEIDNRAAAATDDASIWPRWGTAASPM